MQGKFFVSGLDNALVKGKFFVSGLNDNALLNGKFFACIVEGYVVSGLEMEEG